MISLVFTIIGPVPATGEQRSRFRPTWGVGAIASAAQVSWVCTMGFSDGWWELESHIFYWKMLGVGVQVTLFCSCRPLSSFILQRVSLWTTSYPHISSPRNLLSHWVVHGIRRATKSSLTVACFRLFQSMNELSILTNEWMNTSINQSI